MKVSEFVVNCLIEYGVTDAFGIPGGVILPFLYALEESKIEPHLTYHEQTAGFAACGYAQASGKLGVAYATRGPGISNMFTSIAEAFQESIPVVFITAHGKRDSVEGKRFSANQELDIVASAQNITKYAANIEKVNQVVSCVRNAVQSAVSGRKGPVMIDVFSGIWEEEIEVLEDREEKAVQTADVERIKAEIGEHIASSKRPVILIGDGMRYVSRKETFLSIADQLKIPILSSRGSQDLVSGSSYYYGYVGSHGVRYSNFILSKADLIIAMGNRMAFSRISGSFAPILEQAQIIRVDIDNGELKDSIPGEISYCLDTKELVYHLANTELQKNAEWIAICEQLKHELDNEDCSEPVQKIIEYLSGQDSCIYVCDVGNNEFWFSRAYEKARCVCPVLTSKTFGTLGSALGKAIGAYYGSRKDIVCVVGDQGLQYNIQELQYIVHNRLPINILLINNNCSRMIADHESVKYGEKLLHVTKDTGYKTPNFKEIARAYGVEEKLVEISVDESIQLTPTLPWGRICQDMEPALDRSIFEKLNEL